MTDISKYTIKPGDTFFFDNNIWMFLFSPFMANSQVEKQKKYSLFFEKLINEKKEIYINSLILSEFINANISIDYKNWYSLKEKEGLNSYELSKKHGYKTSDRYKKTIEVIKNICQKILKNTCKFTDNFTSLDIDFIVASIDKADFNDCYYNAFCENSQLILVSDDKDFKLLKNSKTQILTFH